MIEEEDTTTNLKTVNIRRWDIKNIQSNRAMIIVGRPGSGKSYLLNNIMKQLYVNFDACIGMSPTKSSRDMFSQWMPESCIYDQYDADKIIEIVDVMKKLYDNDLEPRIAVLLDDCMFDQKIMKSEAMRYIHMNGRHLNICFINLVQYIVDVPKPLRAVINYVICTNESRPSALHALYDNFFNSFDTFADFRHALGTLTANNGYLVMDTTSGSQNIEDTIFWYKTNESNTKIMVGNRNFWKCHYATYVGRTKVMPKVFFPAFNKEVTAQDSDSDAIRTTPKSTQRLKKSGKNKPGRNSDITINLQKCDENGFVLNTPRRIEA